MKNNSGFIMLEVALASVIMLLLFTFTIRINATLNKELALLTKNAHKLIAVWNRAERNIALRQPNSVQSESEMINNYDK